MKKNYYKIKLVFPIENNVVFAYLETIILYNLTGVHADIVKEDVIGHAIDVGLILAFEEEEYITEVTQITVEEYNEANANKTSNTRFESDF